MQKYLISTIPQYEVLLSLLGSSVNTPSNLNRPSEKQQEHCWLEQNAFLLSHQSSLEPLRTSWRCPKQPWAPSFYPLNAGGSPQHVIFWQTPFSNANEVWRKALSDLGGKRLQRLRAEAHKQHRLSWALSCQKTGTNAAQGGTKGILPRVQWPPPCFSYPCVMISCSDCKGFFFPFSVLRAVWILPQRTH